MGLNVVIPFTKTEPVRVSWMMGGDFGRGMTDKEGDPIFEKP